MDTMAIIAPLLAAAAGYGLLLAGAWALQSRFVYFPDARRADPAAAGLADVRETAFVAPDGARLLAWRAEPDGQDGPVVLYFHGNGANLANRAAYFSLIRDRGWGLAALSYRGYGGSEGRPSEAALVADAFTFYDALVAEGVAPERIVAYGESLGSGVAVRLAAQRAVAGLVLHAPYSAVVDVAAARAPFLLPRRLLRDTYRSRDHIGAVRAPILWMHGDADEVIPLRFGAELFAAAPEPKSSVIVPGAGHMDLYRAEVFARAVAPFVESLAAGASQAVRPASTAVNHVA